MEQKPHTPAAVKESVLYPQQLWLNEDQMEKFLTRAGINITDEEGCTDSGIVVQGAIDYGWNVLMMTDENDQGLYFTHEGMISQYGDWVCSDESKCQYERKISEKEYEYIHVECIPDSNHYLVYTAKIFLNSYPQEELERCLRHFGRNQSLQEFCDTDKYAYRSLAWYAFLLFGREDSQNKAEVTSEIEARWLVYQYITGAITDFVK